MRAAGGGRRAAGEELNRIIFWDKLILLLTI
jgi:hypothetical protein